jgi:hypothetical protein
VPNLTTNYSLLKPLVADPIDEDLWGGYLNDDMDDIDTLIRQGITIENQASQTTGFTATASISVKYLYPCDATAGAFAPLLPTAAAAGDGATVFFQKTDASANAVTVTRASSDTIDGATTVVLSTRYSIVGLVSDGTSKWTKIAATDAVFTGDSGSGGTSGLVPAPAAGDAALNKVLGAGGGWVEPVVVKYAKYTHTLSSGTNGGTTIASTWTVRPINTEDYDEIGITLSSNQLTIPAGTYLISATSRTLSASGTAGGAGARLRNITDSTTIGLSGGEYDGQTTLSANSAILPAKFTIAGSKVIELQYYVTQAQTTNGLGYPLSSGEDEIYAQIFIEKVA